MSNPKLAVFVLRLSIASVFLYASVAATLQPDNWIGYLPQFTRSFIPASLLLLGFSFYQVTLSLWLLSGWKTFYAASLAAITLLVIIFVNLGQVDILFRDFAIFLAAIALAIGGNKPRKTKSAK